MALVQYHGVGTSNTGKVRPAPYKYSSPTDPTNAPVINLFADEDTTVGDVFFGNGSTEFGMSRDQLREWHDRKERREKANEASQYYKRCQEILVHQKIFHVAIVLYQQKFKWHTVA